MSDHSSAGKKVVIIGGGVGGLSAAHELLERGFDVDLYERQAVPGGKARSYGFNGRGANWKRGLPAEHGFRFFPGFYTHVIDTMKRIPVREGHSVHDNLVQTSEGLLAQFDAESIEMPTRFPKSLSELKRALGFFAAKIPVPEDELMFWQERVWQVMTSCEARRFDEYERISWWNFIGASDRSEGYQRFLGNLSRTLVAAVPQRASTKTNGDILIQLLLDMVRPGKSTDRVLNGPTNEVWIHPWLKYLIDGGPNMGKLSYHVNTLADDFLVKDGKITGVRIKPLDGAARVEDVDRYGITATSKHELSGSFVVEGDYYVSAVPVERMAHLLHKEPEKHSDRGWKDLAKADPKLKSIVPLSRCTEWMNGILFYLAEDVPIVNGHTIYVDPPWALTSISQKQFWDDVDLSEYGDGNIKGILSVDISNWREAKGRRTGKAAIHCTVEEVRDEVWADIKASYKDDANRDLGDYVEWFLDEDISEVLEKSNANDEHDHPVDVLNDLGNAEPLLVNETDTWRLRPGAASDIPNLFLAADYVRTNTDLATMEAANEAARRAVNEILRRSGSSAPRCKVFKAELPLPLAPLRLYDKWRYDRGLPWKGRMPASLKFLESIWQFGATAVSGILDRGRR